MSHGDMSHQKTKGSEKPKVSSLREKPKASRVHRDQWVTLNFIPIGLKTYMGSSKLYGAWCVVCVCVVCVCVCVCSIYVTPKKC